MSLDLSRQPVKGLFFTAISLPAALGIWLLVHGLFGLDYASSSLVITICFSWFWQLAWSFGGWPANLVTGNRWLRGSLNWILLMAMVLLTIAVWHWYYGEPFQDTQIGLWGQTAILAGVIAQILVQPPGALASVPAWLRYAAVVAGCLGFVGSRKSIFAGVVCGEIVLLGGKWWLG